MLTLLPPTSEVGVQFPALPQVGNLAGVCREFTVQNLDQLYALVFSAVPPTSPDLYSVISGVKS